MVKKRDIFLLTTICWVAFFANSEITPEVETKLRFIGDMNSLAFMGVEQGLEEANNQGKFFGQHYSLSTTPASSEIILAAVDANEIRQLAKNYPNKMIFNLIATENELRIQCQPNILHIIPSQAMKADAIAQWQQKTTSHLVTAQAWHSTFRKYAASQLNTRFSQATTKKMDDTAWAGWAAVKLVSDSLIRSQKNDTQSLLVFIKTQLAFDGQKGISLNFRDSGQLRQPLLLIKNNKIIGEAPVRGVAAPTNLDSLGMIHCQK